MNSLRIFYTTIGRKLVMALTGLFLCTFLIEHLYGNLLLYKYDGGVAFNSYGNFLVRNIIIRTVEYVLFAVFIIHIIDSLLLTISNRKARPVEYEIHKKSQISNWYSRNMGITGSVLFVFLVIHLRTFFFSHRFGHPDETMAQSVAIAFSHAWYSILYIFSMLLLGFHLNHGAQSSFQTMGWNNHKYMPLVKGVGTLFALIMAVGFASFPVMFYFDVFGIATDILK